MPGNKASFADDDYEAPDGEDRQTGDKPLSSKYRGVCWNRKNKRWQAAINSSGKYVYLGSFISEYDAARAFDKAAVKLRGTRAKLNFAYSEYVDEHGNLLEDPKMKSVMYKIEAIQGGGGGGGAGGHKHDHSGDEGAGGPNDGSHPHPSIPLPGLPLPGAREEATGPGGRHQVSPLNHHTAGKPGQQQQQQGGLQLGPLGGDLPLPLPLPNGGGLHHHGVGGVEPGGLYGLFQDMMGPGASVCQAAITLPLALPSTMGPGGVAAGKATPQPAPAPRARVSSTHGQTPQPLPGLPPYGALAGNGYDGPAAPGGHGGLGEPASGTGGVMGNQLPTAASPSSVVQRAIQGELGPMCHVLSYVPNRGQSSVGESFGVLYSDSRHSGLVGSLMWTGSRTIKMGLYDTDRDAYQASIKCMQLFAAFGPDDRRPEVQDAIERFNMAAAAEHGGDSGGLQGAGAAAVGMPPLLPPHSLYGGRNASRGAVAGSTSGLGDAHFDAHHPPHHPSHHHQQQPGAPYMRTSANGGPTPSMPYGSCSDASAASRLSGPLSQGAVPPGQLQVGSFGQAALEGGPDATSQQHPQLGGAAAQQKGAEGAGSVLGKRGAADDLAQLQMALHQQKQQQQAATAAAVSEHKRMRLEPGATPDGGSAGEEFRAAHKLSLASISKQLQQVQTAGQ